jgi:hypothetical protein
MQSLPPHVLCHILHPLKLKDCNSLIQTCKQFHQVWKAPLLWQIRLYHDFGDRVNGVRAIKIPALTDTETSEVTTHYQLYRRYHTEFALRSSVYQLICYLTELIWYTIQREALSQGLKAQTHAHHLSLYLMVFMTFPPTGLESLLKLAQPFSQNGCFLTSIHRIQIEPSTVLNKHDLTLALLDLFRKIHYPSYSTLYTLTQLQGQSQYITEPVRAGRLNHIVSNRKKLLQAILEPTPEIIEGLPHEPHQPEKNLQLFHAFLSRVDTLADDTSPESKQIIDHVCYLARSLAGHDVTQCQQIAHVMNEIQISWEPGPFHPELADQFISPYAPPIPVLPAVSHNRSNKSLAICYDLLGWRPIRLMLKQNSSMSDLHVSALHYVPRLPYLVPLIFGLRARYILSDHCDDDSLSQLSMPMPVFEITSDMFCKFQAILPCQAHGSE